MRDWKSESKSSLLLIYVVVQKQNESNAYVDYTFLSDTNGG